MKFRRCIRKMKKKRRRKNMSVLLIPDDYADPISFKLSFNVLKILLVVACIIIVHLLSGIVFYYKFAVVSTKNKHLNRENVQLKDDNKKIYSMYEIVNDFLQYQERVRDALGIKQFEVSDRRSNDILNKISPSVEIMPSQPTFLKEDNEVEGKLDFLTQTKSSYHGFAENIPTYLPVEGFLTTDFHESDWFFPYRHHGIDIAAKKGTPVRAAADGIVLFANWTNELGNLIIIYHSNEFLTYYGHNQVLLKKERSTVKKGEIIALLGSSGKSTAPHLHFEIRKNGVPVDPKEYLISFQSR